MLQRCCLYERSPSRTVLSSAPGSDSCHLTMVGCKSDSTERVCRVILAFSRLAENYESRHGEHGSGPVQYLIWQCGRTSKDVLSWSVQRGVYSLSYHVHSYSLVEDVICKGDAKHPPRWHHISKTSTFLSGQLWPEITVQIHWEELEECKLNTRLFS